MKRKLCGKMNGSVTPTSSCGHHAITAFLSFSYPRRSADICGSDYALCYVCVLCIRMQPHVRLSAMRGGGGIYSGYIVGKRVWDRDRERVSGCICRKSGIVVALQTADLPRYCFAAQHFGVGVWCVHKLFVCISLSYSLSRFVESVHVLLLHLSKVLVRTNKRSPNDITSVLFLLFVEKHCVVQSEISLIDRQLIDSELLYAFRDAAHVCCYHVRAPRVKMCVSLIEYLN